MNCETARELMVEADLGELRGEGGSDLVRHLGVCHACRERATVILGGMDTLRAYLAAAQPERARVAALPGVVTGSRRGGGPWARRWPALVPLALAAGLAVLLIARRAPAPPRGTLQPAATPAAFATSLAAASLDVEGPPGRNVTVFRTDNPNIVVIWSF